MSHCLNSGDDPAATIPPEPFHRFLSACPCQPVVPGRQVWTTTLTASPDGNRPAGLGTIYATHHYIYSLDSVSATLSHVSHILLCFKVETYCHVYVHVLCVLSKFLKITYVGHVMFIYCNVSEWKGHA